MRTYFLTTLSFGIDVINILKKSSNISGIIGLSERQPDDSISGYYYMAQYCDKNKIDFIEVNSYSLNNNSDREKLLNLDIDILVVSGWQRLIPQWLIKHIKGAAIGLHGSPYGITLGRGRSPQNWSLIMGKKEFYISAFKIDKDIDSGAVISEMKYEISDSDDISILYNKLCWYSCEMIGKILIDGKIKEDQLFVQDLKPQYFPQRLPEDGQLDWNRLSNDVYNFIRALTRPYPGAYTTLKDSGNKVIIWRARPFKIDFDIQGKPGQILKIYSNGTFLVKTLDGAIHIDEYRVLKDGVNLKEGDQFQSVNFQEQLSQIIKRHQNKYPSLQICSDLVELSKN